MLLHPAKTQNFYQNWHYTGPYKKSISKYRMIEIIQNMSSDHSGIKVEINNEVVSRKMLPLPGN